MIRKARAKPRENLPTVDSKRSIYWRTWMDISRTERLKGLEVGRIAAVLMAFAMVEYGSPAYGDDASPGDNALQEIVVTAEKREERLLDVPMSLTALSGDELARAGSYRLEDFVGKVPGLSVVDA